MLAEGEFPPATIPKICIALKFIELVKAATLVSQFSPQELADFLNPEEHKSASPDDPNLRFSLLNFISLMSSSQDAYEAVRQNGQQCFPGVDLLSYFQVKQCTRTLTGLVF